MTASSPAFAKSSPGVSNTPIQLLLNRLARASRSIARGSEGTDLVHVRVRLATRHRSCARCAEPIPPPQARWA